jgi:hypothetical protein
MSNMEAMRTEQNSLGLVEGPKDPSPQGPGWL